MQNRLGAQPRPSGASAPSSRHGQPPGPFGRCCVKPPCSLPKEKRSSPRGARDGGDRLFTPGNRERCNSFFLLKEIEVSEILQHQQELYVPRVVSPQRLPRRPARFGHCPARLQHPAASAGTALLDLHSAPRARARLQLPTSSDANYWLVCFGATLPPN